MHQWYISAAHKSSGKTTISLGLARLLSQNYAVQTFKKGPDYIDPIWLTEASGNPCYNLDFWNMSNKEMQSLYNKHAKEITIVEGNKGLFDGMSTTGGDTNADVARLLDIPVILVIDCVGITRGIAPLLQGYQHFDSEAKIAGIVLNKVGGPRHEAKLRNAVATYTDLRVIGAVHTHRELMIDERHLGLIPANEASEHSTTIDTIAHILTESIDTNLLLEITQSTCIPNTPNTPNTPSEATTGELTIAIAKDKAFGFYYHDDLDVIRQHGNVVFFDALRDEVLPKCDALFIGGGFPEMHLEALSNNTTLRADIRTKVTHGLPTYAECGGMMYLSSMIDGYPMVGVIDGDIALTKRPVGRGYMKLQVNEHHHPWGATGQRVTHEFHYSQFSRLNETNFAFHVERGVGITGKKDGIVKYNMLATYTHQRSVGGHNWVAEFMAFARSQKN